MPIIAIDPGPEKSAMVCIDIQQPFETMHWYADNATIRKELYSLLFSFPNEWPVAVVIEQVKSYGMSVGDDVFGTCYASGRFIQVAHDAPGYQTSVYLMPRRDVKLYLCDSIHATKSNVRRAVLDAYPATGGGATPQKGTKAQPGPLYGVSGDHKFDALALALTYKGDRDRAQLV